MASIFMAARTEEMHPILGILKESDISFLHFPCADVQKQ